MDRQPSLLANPDRIGLGLCERGRPVIFGPDGDVVTSMENPQATLTERDLCGWCQHGIKCPTHPNPLEGAQLSTIGYRGGLGSGFFVAVIGFVILYVVLAYNFMRPH